ncbi:MAG: CNNM domain-containing protein [Patescibacteria group bacterium]|jgi:metal transporter CNNM|nr:CNNM domain-containing protein [Patescibacteria group bacterium]
MDYLIIAILLLFSALFSGLTLGFFSLNKNDLERKADLGDKQAKKILLVRKDGNLLLSTLLISNVAVNSVLSIFLGSITSGIVAVLIATGLIVIFGEIIPQASFSRNALSFGAKFVWLIILFRAIFYIFTKPIAMALDKILGEELPTVYSKKELMKMIEEHEDSPVSDIDEDEERIVKGALAFSGMKVSDVMTKAENVFMLSSKQILDNETLDLIIKKGFSRIPIHNGSSATILGILYAKDLISEDTHNKLAEEVARSRVVVVEKEKNLDHLLNDFRKSRNHLFIVKELDEFVGIVTIEDVLEEIIDAEIFDEFDNQ